MITFHLVRYYNPQSTPFGSVSRTAAIAKAMPNIGALANSKTNAVISDYAEQTTFHVVNVTDSTTAEDWMSGGIMLISGPNVPNPTIDEQKEAFKKIFGKTLMLPRSLDPASMFYWTKDHEFRLTFLAR